MADFVHLHVHSQYSMLDGLAPVSALVDKAVADGQRGIALTDHGNMYGIKEMYNYVQKLRGKGSDFKAILGCEMYVANHSRLDRQDKRDTGKHLIVLAKNLTGYHNMVRLVSDACLNGMYYKPRTDHEQLERYHEGLIVCSACLGGEIPHLIMEGDVEGAERAILWFKRVFGEDYYLELQRHKATRADAAQDTYECQVQVNKVLLEMARKHGIKVIATNDVHFVDEADADAHERLICVSTQRTIDDAKLMRYTKQEWLKTQAEMSQVFADVPEALTNTLEILDKVEDYSIDHAPIMPFFEIPAEFGTEEQWREKYTEQDLYKEFTGDENGQSIMTPEEGQKKIAKMGGYDKLYRIKFEADYLAKLAWEGARRRYGDELSEELQERIRFELHVMKTMGFPGYFLIVQDFINEGRNHLDVSIGPGRGSAAGSVVAYCLGITQIDPLKYDLLFERFLNPDRISLPDIDVDFDDDGRERVLQYVTEKYGAEKVAHIITYGTMAAKTAIRDVARSQGVSIPEAIRLTKLIPSRTFEVNGKELKPTLANCLRYVPEVKAELEGPNADVSTTLRFAEKLEGCVRSKGVHACGVIICRDPITDWVPVDTAADTENAPAATDHSAAPKVVVTQYEGSIIEDTGLIKMDFLGLKTLSIIRDALTAIKQSLGKDVDIDHIPLDDPATYKLYCDGRTRGTFQFESPGMQKYLRELQPSQFEDLIAMNALYRPGPMQYIPDFIARKHGRSPITYDIPEMEKYLSDTYGVTVYQEQVMLLSRLLAGFTRGQSDTLRKAMGKKQIDKMNHLEGLFYKGGEERGHDHDTLAKIWTDWKEFAKYAFNKSHATCYSWIAYQTAYLKANYPAQYMSAVLSRNKTDKTKLTTYMDECRAMHIPVKGPDVNESFQNFGVNGRGEIRFGLEAISGLGANITSQIVATRNQGGPYKDIYDMMERMPQGSISRRVIEALAASGALDCLGLPRETYFTTNIKDEPFSELLARYAAQWHTAKEQSSMSLFGFDDEISTAGRPEAPKPAPWSDLYRLDRERELVGMYLSAHPLDPYYMQLTYGVGCTLAQFKDMTPRDGQEVSFGGLVTNNQTKPTRKGDRFGILTIEDFTDSTDIRLFGQQFLDYGSMQIGSPVLITGRWQRRYNSPELNFNITAIRHLDSVKEHLITGITVHAAPDDLTPSLLAALGPWLKPKKAPEGEMGTLSLAVTDTPTRRTVTLTSPQRIHISRSLLDTLRDDLGLTFTIHNA